MGYVQLDREHLALSLYSMLAVVKVDQRPHAASLWTYISRTGSITQCFLSSIAYVNSTVEKPHSVLQWSLWMPWEACQLAHKDASCVGVKKGLSRLQGRQCWTGRQEGKVAASLWLYNGPCDSDYRLRCRGATAEHMHIRAVRHGFVFKCAVWK